MQSRIRRTNGEISSGSGAVTVPAGKAWHSMKAKQSAAREPAHDQMAAKQTAQGGLHARLLARLMRGLWMKNHELKKL
jgi:hypothetical protein